MKESVFFGRNMKKKDKSYHGSRLKKEDMVSDGNSGVKLYSANNPKINNLKSSNNDTLWGPGVYTADFVSVDAYSKIHGGDTFEIEIKGKKMFDLNKVLFLIKMLMEYITDWIN